MTTNWRLAASDTHLYPGARLECLEPEAAGRFAAGDLLVVEFTDGVVAGGTIKAASSRDAIVHVDAYRTRHGAPIRSRQWRLVPGGQPGAIRVQARIP
jgi:hypothetical protein